MNDTNYINVSCPPRFLWLGREQENNYRSVTIDCANWFSTYPNATIAAYYQPYGVSDPYPLVLTADGTKRIWHPTATELVRGDGELQIVLMLGDVVGTSAIIPTRVDRSLISSADHPAEDAPSWTVQVVEDVTEQADRAEEATSHYPKIVNGVWYVWSVQDEDFVSTGIEAQGEDGYSPTVTVTAIEGGHRVTITDADGAHTFDVMDGIDGTDGEDGTDGVSPTVTVTDIAGGHRVTITDAEHPQGQSFDVMDGEDGELDFITPEQFGAVGDGETDDVVALQSAFDYCYANRVMLHFPAGKTYKIASPIVLKASSGGKYRLNGTSGKLNNPNIKAAHEMFVGDNYTNAICQCSIDMDGLFLYGYDTECFKGINIAGTSAIRNCQFYYFSFWLQGCLSGFTTVTNCRFQGLGRAFVCGYVFSGENTDVNTVDFSTALYSAQTNDSVFIVGNYIHMSQANKNYVFVGAMDEDVHVTNCWIEMGRAVHLLLDGSFTSPFYSNCVFQRFVTFYEPRKACEIFHAYFDQCQFMSFNSSKVGANQFDANDVFVVFASVVSTYTLYLNLHLTQCDFVSCTNSVKIHIRTTAEEYDVSVDGCSFKQTPECEVLERKSSARQFNKIKTGKIVYLPAPIAEGECPYQSIDGANIYLYPRDADLIYWSSSRTVLYKIICNNSNLLVRKVYDTATVIPTKVSDLTNDSNFQTAAQVQSAIAAAAELPTGGTTGDFLRKTATGVAWETVQTWQGGSY